MGQSWLVPWHPHPYQHPVLLCLPPAGAGCGQFRSWQSSLGAAVSVVGVQLPGRETRWADPPPATIDEAVGAVVAELRELVPVDQQLIVFGHSFGALLGYEIARWLGLRCGRWPDALVVAACRPPHMWVGAGRGLVDDEGELRQLLDNRRLDQDELDDDSRELMLEVLRQDAQLALSYTDPCRTPVSCPLEVWGGAQDPTVLPEHLVNWRDYASGDFRQRQFAGGHYFFLEPAESIPALLGQLVDKAGREQGKVGR